MNRLRKKIFKFVELIQREHCLVYSEDLPEPVNDKTIYIVGNPKTPWLLALKCPCGCQNLIQLNLLKDVDPCWRYKITKKKKINVSPSVWRTTGCKSHFFVRKSKIEWVRNYEPRHKTNSFIRFWK